MQLMRRMTSRSVPSMAETMLPRLSTNLLAYYSKSKAIWQKQTDVIRVVEGKMSGQSSEERHRL